MTNQNARNILFVIPNLDFGGAQRSLCKVSKIFSKHHNVYVCSFNLNSGVAYKHGGQLIDLRVSAGENLISKVSNFILRCIRLRILKRILRIDTCISYLEGANYVNVLSRYKEKVVISVRGSKLFDSNIKGPKGRLRLRILLPLLYKFPDDIVALSHGIRKELIESFKLDSEKIRVIYNFYNLSKIELLGKVPIPDQFRSIFDGTTLISAGRLSPEKGLDKLLRLFAQLKKLRSEVVLVFLGEGPSLESLIECSRALKLSTYETLGESFNEPIDQDVYFLGYQENPFRFFSNSTLFMLTSNSEGGPNAMSEAMSCGLPVMSVDCPSGPRERLSLSVRRPSDNISKPEFADFGILMPQFHGRADTQVIQCWVDTLDKVLSDSSLLSSYSEKARLRMADFSESEIIPHWQRVVL